MAGSRAPLLLLRGGGGGPTNILTTTTTTTRSNSFAKSLFAQRSRRTTTLSCSISAIKSNLEPPNVARLAETARISLTPQEVEKFAPKIQQVVDWFGQLQSVDLESIEPAIRAETEGENLREDQPETFENWEAIVAAIPSYEEPYIKVPKVLNKE